MFQQPLNRRFYEGPDVETLNILIELGEIVKKTPDIDLKIAPNDVESTESSLLGAAASAISGVKALRKLKKVANRLTEPAIDAVPVKRPKGSYDFRLPVFREGGE